MSGSRYAMYFVAILCPPGTNEKVQAMKHWMKEQYGCVVALKSPAHITLIPPFWAEETAEPQLLKTARDYNDRFDKLEIVLDGFSHFGRKVLFVNVVKNPQLEALKHSVEDHFALAPGAVIRKEDRPFHPHVTIASRDLKPGDFITAWEHFSNKTYSSSFISSEINVLKLTNGKWNALGPAH